MNKPINHTTKELLKTKMKPKYKGLVLKFDNFLLNQRISDSAKLVYAGLYFSVPEARRIEQASKQLPVKFIKAKKELFPELGISRSTFYRAIKELERVNLLKTKSAEHGRTYYELNHYLELTFTDIKAMVTTQILKHRYVRTTKKDKTYSSKAKIVLGRLSQLSRSKYDRNITATASDLRTTLNLKKSTTYYLIKQFLSCNTMEQQSKEKTVFTLLLLDEYSIHQRKINAETNGQHRRKPPVKNKELNKAEDNALDILYSIA